jgi:hypothetical protein
MIYGTEGRRKPEIERKSVSRDGWVMGLGVLDDADLGSL